MPENPTPEELAQRQALRDNVRRKLVKAAEVNGSMLAAGQWFRLEDLLNEADDTHHAYLELQAENKRTAERMGFLRGEGPEALATWYMYLLKLPEAMQLAIARYLKPKIDALLTDLEERVKVAEAENAVVADERDYWKNRLGAVVAQLRQEGREEMELYTDFPEGSVYGKPYCYLQAENAKLREQVMALEEERRWIPVTERLPEVDGLYEAVYFVPNRIHGRSKSVSDVLYFERDDAGPLWSINAGCIVTHWREIGALPAAPTEKAAKCGQCLGAGQIWGGYDCDECNGTGVISDEKGGAE